jgi:hypothetical protein
MPARIAAILVTAAAALSLAPGANAATTPNRLLIIPAGSPYAEVQSLSTVPLGFTTSASQAMRIAETSPKLQALHRREHPLKVVPYVWRSSHPYWYVEFIFHGKIVGTAAVSPAGKLTGSWTGLQAAAPLAQGNTGSLARQWWILAPAALLFLLVFVDPRRLRRIVYVDAIAVLSFVASLELVARGHIELGVWLVYPPLLYLMGRLLWLGSGRGRESARLAPLLRTPVLAVGLLAMLASRIALALLSHTEADIGYQSLIGASRILHHLPIYWNDPGHGDTYGPITYLAYVPFELLFPVKATLANLRGADVAAIFFDLGTVGGLVLLGRRLRAGAEGMRLGLVLAWAWAACPFTIYGLSVHTNDALVSMLSVFALLAVASPVLSGAVLGLAAAAKFSPAALLPLLAAPRERGRKGVALCMAAFAAVLGLAIFAWLPPQGVGYFWRHTVGFQMTRPDVFSPWAIHPTLHPLQVALEAFAVLLAGAVAWFPKDRSLMRTCALAGAVMIAIQLPAKHWFYYYVMWFLPFALVAFLAGDRRDGDAGPAEPAEILEPIAIDARERILTGA